MTEQELALLQELATRTERFVPRTAEEWGTCRRFLVNRWVYLSSVVTPTRSGHHYRSETSYMISQSGRDELARWQRVVGPRGGGNEFTGASGGGESNTHAGA